MHQPLLHWLCWNVEGMSPNHWGSLSWEAIPSSWTFGFAYTTLKADSNATPSPCGFTGSPLQPQAVYFLDQSISGCQNKLKATLKSVAQCKLEPNFETSEFWKNRSSVQVPKWKNRCYGNVTPFLTLTVGPWIWNINCSLRQERQNYLLSSLQPLSCGQRGRLRPLPYNACGFPCEISKAQTRMFSVRSHPDGWGCKTQHRAQTFCWAGAWQSHSKWYLCCNVCIIGCPRLIGKDISG